MTYLNAVKYLRSLIQDEGSLSDPSVLERMRAACNKFEYHLRPIKCIHVCGEIGKDSCCLMLSSILNNASYKAGRFSAFDPDDFKSSISVAGKQISHSDFADIITDIYRFYRSNFKETVPHLKEILTLAAIHYFQKEKCDVAIFEKSHSRYDPVNITGAPVISVITPFTERETDSGVFEAIIHKGTVETVSSPQHKEIYNAISDACSVAGSRLTIPIYSEMEIEKITLFKTFFKYRNTDYSVRSFSPCQTVNAITAIEIANSLNRIGATISDEAISKGIAMTNLDGKCETISLNPTVILSSSCEKDQLDTLFASLAQVKEHLPPKITFNIDPEADINIDEFSESLDTRNIPHYEIIETVPSAADIKAIKKMISEQESDKPLEHGAVFIGKREFISVVKSLILKHFGS